MSDSTASSVVPPASAVKRVPKRLLTGPVAAAALAVCSTSVFQAPQEGHLPSHLGLLPPHSVQT